MFEVQDLKYATLATVSRCGKSLSFPLSLSPIFRSLPALFIFIVKRYASLCLFQEWYGSARIV